MSSIVIDRQSAKLSYRNGAMELHLPHEAPKLLPLRGVERLLIQGSATVSTGLLSQCWERRISVLVLSGRRQAPGPRFHGRCHNDAALRVAQILVCHDSTLRLRVARMIVLSKFRRQQALLASLAHSRPGGTNRAKPARAALARAIGHLLHSPPEALNELRGIEGAAAAGYFRSYAQFFPPALGFHTRRRRPPPDPVNALLSLGYTLATFEAGRAVAIAGLDPAVGALHGLSYGRDSLALDLVETLRPMVDDLVHHLFRKRILVGSHFQTQPDGGVLLGKAGRRHFYNEWENRAPHLRRLAAAQARLAVRWLRTQNTIWPTDREA